MASVDKDNTGPSNVQKEGTLFRVTPEVVEPTESAGDAERGGGQSEVWLPITAPSDVTDIVTPDEYIAGLLGAIKITPESFRKETGLRLGEQRKLVGIIAGKDKGGVSVERASEIIFENFGDELVGLGFSGEQPDIRNMMIPRL